MGRIITFEDEPAEPTKRPDLRQLMREAIANSTRPCTELSNLGIPQREPVLGQWFKEGDLGFVFAPRGLGKTWLSLSMAASIASGQTCGPWTAHRSLRTLYVDGEMPCDALDQRIQGMGGVENLTVLSHEALFHLNGCTLNLAEEPSRLALTDYLLSDGVRLLVLDNLSCLFSGISENEADAWEPVKEWLLSLRRYQIAVIIVHHSGRNKETMRGTSKREDDAFWVIRLDAVETEHREGAEFISRFTKERNNCREEKSYHWSFRTNPDDSVQITTKEASSIDVFRQWIEDGLTGAEDIAREMGLSKGTISKMASKAISEGWLKKVGREYALV